MNKYLLVLLVMIVGCASQSDYMQLRGLTLNIARAHNILLERVQKLEPSPTPTPVKK